MQESIKHEQIKKATIRFETNPGLQAQVDWKETMTLKNREGKKFTINIFSIILGYSRFKYIKLTLDRTQQTVFQSLTDAFNYFGGVPKKILFDNMKTVVDHAKSEYANPQVNQKMYCELTEDKARPHVIVRDDLYIPETS